MTDDEIYRDDFSCLEGWHHEGGGRISSPEPGVLRMECVGSRQGGEGCMAFCRTDFPDGIALEYDVIAHKSNGLLITFVAFQGLSGEDALTDLPPRSGVFADYVGPDAKVRSYHVSISRYNDSGEHTGVCNWRRNPGLHLMAQGEDPCRVIGRKYAVRIEKSGPRCAIVVDGRPGPAFDDPQRLPGEIPRAGKIGFRAIGSAVILDISQFRVRKL